MYWQERVQKKRNRDKYPCPSSLACLVHSPRPINCANRDDKPEHHVKAVRMLAGRCNEQQYCAEHRQNYFQDSSTVHDRSTTTIYPTFGEMMPCIPQTTGGRIQLRLL